MQVIYDFSFIIKNNDNKKLYEKKKRQLQMIRKIKIMIKGKLRMKKKNDERKS